MTPNEFTAWLDGFLDGKDSLTADQIATLRAKVAQVHSAPAILPTLPNVWPTLPNIVGPQWPSPGTGTPMPLGPSVTCGSLVAAADPNIRLTN